MADISMQRLKLLTRGDDSHRYSRDQSPTPTSALPDDGQIQICGINNRSEIWTQLHFWLSVAGFKTAHRYYIAVVFLFILLNTAVNAYLIPTHSICMFLAITVFTFQLESFILYWFGYFILNEQFQLYFVDILCHSHLTHCNFNSKQAFRKDLLWTTFIMSFSYFSGAFIIWEYDVKNAKHDFAFWYAVVSNSLDFLRYLPQIVHIAVITLFYRVFVVQLEYLRNKYKIPSRKYDRNAPEIEIQFDQFTTELKDILFPYNNMMSKKSLTLWISAYMLLNVLSIIVFWGSILSPDCSATNNRSRSNTNAYYLHYLAELSANFVGWIFLVYPIYQCHSKLSSFIADIGEANVANIGHAEYTAIMTNLQHKIKYSPFSIGGWDVTLSRMARILLFVVSTLIFDAVSNFGGFRFWNCDRR